VAGGIERDAAPIQDLYPDDFAHCYGCGRLNAHGLHVHTFWRDGEGLAEFQPSPHHMAMPGYVYGGLLASLVDCHAMATAAAATMEVAGQHPGVDPTPRFVTASLQVDYLRPTPLGPALQLRATVAEKGGRKVIVQVSVTAEGTEVVRGRVVAVPIPPSMAR
jgi:acyl-coenzyme A thioesterase PaaI-like protein